MSDEEEMFVEALDESELQEGSLKLVNVNGIHVLLIKTHGEIFAIDDHCPHMSCGFSGGALDDYVIICPCHDWRFDLRTGEYEEEKEFQLTKYKWKIKAGKIWVKLED
jgi:nitrite reductase/ring-hydroxylating ferredoxin subunit